MSLIASLKMRIRHRYHIFPKVSVIVPIYNAEHTLKKCLYSILLGKHVPIEIICVNDGSEDSSLKVIREMRRKYGCIRIVSYEANKGLYYARMLGIKKARGKYLGFADSDDYVCEGYFDKLYASIKRNDADIAVGQIVNQSANGCRYVQTRCAEFPYTAGKSTESIYDLYWAQEGKNYHWHVVWNKLYKKDLWIKKIAAFDLQTNHLVMLEDFIYSSIVLSDVKKYSVDCNAQYNYVLNDESSIHDYSLEKVKKNITDMIQAFNFIEKFIESDTSFNKYRKNINEWKKRYARYWKRNLDNSTLNQDEREECIEMLYNICSNEIGSVTAEDEYYYAQASFL